MDGLVLLSADDRRTNNVRAARHAVCSAANTFNIGADLGGMAKITEMVTGIPECIYWTPALTIDSFLIWSFLSPVLLGANIDGVGHLRERPDLCGSEVCCHPIEVRCAVKDDTVCDFEARAVE